jgi:hypothetical protein
VLSFKVEVFKAGVNPLEVKADTMLLSVLKLKLGQSVKGMNGKSYAVAGTTPRGKLLIKGANGKTYKCKPDFLLSSKSIPPSSRPSSHHTAELPYHGRAPISRPSSHRPESLGLKSPTSSCRCGALRPWSNNPEPYRIPSSHSVSSELGLELGARTGFLSLWYLIIINYANEKKQVQELGREFIFCKNPLKFLPSELRILLCVLMS